MDYSSFNSNQNNQSFGGNFDGGQSFSSSQFGGGGGFVQDGGDFAGSQGGSQKSPTTIKKRDAQTLVPLTIKQIVNVDHKDGKFKIDGKDVSQISIIGVVLSIEVQPTNINYMIDDGTGKMNVRLYVDSDEEGQAKHTQIRENQYVRVIGNLRILGTPAVVAFQLIPITDFNEITFHYLETIHTHCLNTRGKPGVSPSKAAGAVPGAAPAAMNSNVSSNDFGAVADGDSSFNDLQSQVLNIFNQDSNSESGTSIQTVCERLSHLSRGDIQKAIEFLSDEGHLYSTIDEEHYKSTAGG